VRADIVATLGLDPTQLRTFTTTTARPNLHYEVRFTSETHDTRFDYLVAWLRAMHHRRATDPARSAQLAAHGERATAVSGIVYATQRAECDALAARLRGAGIGAAPYHAGMAAVAREAVQARWIGKEPGSEVVVATTAFGMGIDKADVRFVVHWSLPKSFEGFYQEAGRAGRDGRAGLCLLFYGREERDRRLRLLHMDEMAGERRERGGGGGGKGGEAQREGRAKSLRQLVEYCEGTDRCRHRAIVAYFGEAEGAAVCDFACDWCKDAEGLRKRKEEGLASEEWVSTQREREDFYAAGYDDA
jgi:bloom syndrome protein